MAEIRVSKAGVYVEHIGASISISKAGIYVETNTIEIRISKAGAYIEIIQLDYDVLFKNREYDVVSLKVNQSLSIAESTVFASLAKEKIPTLPTWVVEMTTLWNRETISAIGDPTNQTVGPLSLRVTDRNGNTVTLYNSQAFIIGYDTKLTIDNAIILDLQFVGSGILNSS